jgi:hypothetical protein
MQTKIILEKLVTYILPLMELQDKFLATVFAESNKLAQHPLYTKHLGSIEGISRFMETHVFAVWDFMSLVKSLQRDLTCISLPWVPVGSANTRYLINEIVLGEESDVDLEGNRISHFELYRQAMLEVGASTMAIDNLLAALSQGKTVNEALDLCGGPSHAVAFTKHTFEVIEKQPIGIRAAVFAFGREDLIPKMFMPMVAQLEEQSQIKTFKYYLERHIEVDGGHHSHLAWEMTKELLGNDPALWQQATEVVMDSLQERGRLWDGVVG